MEDTSKTQGQTQSQPQPQAGGVGTIVNKEQELTTGSQTDSSVLEFVEPSGAEIEPKVHPELEKMGVESVSETPQLDAHAQNLGVRHSGESVRVVPTGYSPVTMTEDVAQQTLKNTQLSDSIKWRAALVVKFFKKMHGKLLRGKN